MTLTTKFRTDAPINPLRLHDGATELVNPTGIEVSLCDNDGPGERWNRPGLGLDAWIWTYWGVDGPLDQAGIDRPEDDPEDRDPDWTAAPRALVEVHMDTPYGYESNALHAAICLRLAEIVRAEHPGAGCWWYDEYRGTWHDVADRAALIAFVGTTGGIEMVERIFGSHR